MHPFISHLLLKNPNNESDKQIQPLVQEFDYNITEGGEFLDDALRMVDQPLMYTEESVAAGSPKGLLW